MLKVICALKLIRYAQVKLVAVTIFAGCLELVELLLLLVG
jgi:hypothetical protein